LLVESHHEQVAEPQTVLVEHAELPELLLLAELPLLDGVGEAAAPGSTVERILADTPTWL
jgi:hypothetical protein